MTLPMAGAEGTAEETSVKLRAVVAALALPAASTSTTVMVCAPLASGLPGVKLQAPAPLTRAVPSRVVLSKILTVSPAPPVPLKVGWLSSVLLLLATSPCKAPTLSLMATSVGAAGVAVSTLRLTGVLLVLPAASVLTRVRLSGPWP